MELAQVLSLLLNFIKCPICLNYMFAAIFQCRNGHSICRQCKARLPRCPFCRENNVNVRNLALERIAQELVYPCKYSRKGCSAVVPLSALLLHQKFCRFNAYCCYLQVYPGIPCNFYGPSHLLQAHLRVHHSYFTVEQPLGGCTYFHLLGFQPCGRWNIMITAFEDIFNCSFITDQENVYAYLNYVGPAEEATKYRQEITIMNLEKTENGSYSGDVLSFYVDEIEVLKTLPCFHTTFHYVRRLMNGHKFLLARVRITKRLPQAAAGPLCAQSGRVWDVRGVPDFSNAYNAQACPNSRIRDDPDYFYVGPVAESNHRTYQKQQQNVRNSFSLATVSRNTVTTNNQKVASQLQPSSVVPAILNFTASSSESSVSELSSDSNNEVIEYAECVSVETTPPENRTCDMELRGRLENVNEPLPSNMSDSASCVLVNFDCPTATDNPELQSTSYDVDLTVCGESKIINSPDSEFDNYYCSSTQAKVSDPPFNLELLSSHITAIANETEMISTNLLGQSFINSAEPLVPQLSDSEHVAAVYSDRISTKATMHDNTSATTSGAMVGPGLSESDVRSNMSLYENCSPSSETQNLIEDNTAVRYTKANWGPSRFKFENELCEKCSKGIAKLERSEKLNQSFSLRNINENLTNEHDSDDERYDEAKAVEPLETEEFEQSHFKFQKKTCKNCSKRITTLEVCENLDQSFPLSNSREELINGVNYDCVGYYDARTMESHEAPNCGKLNVKFDKEARKVCSERCATMEICGTTEQPPLSSGTGVDDIAEELPNENRFCEEATATEPSGKPVVRKAKKQKKKSKKSSNVLFYFHEL